VESAATPLLELEGDEPDGAISDDGLVFGTHLHGLFDNPLVLEAIRRFLGITAPYSEGRADRCLDELADALEGELDMGLIERLAGLK
jgi:adenosylcobyric acid synthase